MLICEGGGGWCTAGWLVGRRWDGCAHTNTNTNTHTHTHTQTHTHTKCIFTVMCHCGKFWEHFANRLWLLSWCHRSSLHTLVRVHIHTHTHTHTHTYTHTYTHKPPSALDQGFCKARIIPANPHSLRMNCMIGCHHHQPPHAPPFTPLSHEYTLTPAPWISGSFDGDFNKLLQIAACMLVAAVWVSTTPTTPVSANQARFN